MTTPIVVMSDKERVVPNAVVFFAHSLNSAESKHFTAPIVLAAFLQPAHIHSFRSAQHRRLTDTGKVIPEDCLLILVTRINNNKQVNNYYMNT